MLKYRAFTVIDLNDPVQFQDAEISTSADSFCLILFLQPSPLTLFNMINRSSRLNCGHIISVMAPSAIKPSRLSAFNGVSVFYLNSLSAIALS